MRIAVVGSGVSGLVSAWLLSKAHRVTLYEADARLGGHVHTHEVELQGRKYRVDSGFIVHNPVNYPLLTRLLAELRIASQPTTMSFSVRNASSGLEYNTGTLIRLFCQPRNLISPRFHGMLLELLRFYRQSPQLLDSAGPGPTLGEYLSEGGYHAAFRDEHLVPMASALWSAPSSQVLEFPARYLVQFMANHRMLQITRRPQWRVIRGGSWEYVRALRDRWTAEERLGTPVTSIRRNPDGVEVFTATGHERFDHVVLACHSDQALALLTDASSQERDILGTIRYQENAAVLHTDSKVLPRNRKAWAAWNVVVPRKETSQCSVSYYMNQLQNIDAPEPLIVTLNGSDEIDPSKILREMRYEHPVYSHASVSARSRKAEIQGVRRTWFAGAYWAWGFHEDGMRSAVEVADALGVHWPVAHRNEPYPLRVGSLGESC